jgi:hypothetical protein
LGLGKHGLPRVIHRGLLIRGNIGLTNQINHRLRWTPLSRPFFARNKLMPGGVFWGLSFGAASEAAPPFRPSNRRSGRIPAEPYPRFECFQCNTNILARKR